jgi:tetratricopeptide (TPR) repeat protein
MKSNRLIPSLTTIALSLAQFRYLKSRSRHCLNLIEQGKGEGLKFFESDRFQLINGRSSKEAGISPQELQQQILRYREAGDRQNEAATLINLGAKYISLNQFTQALETYNQALALCRQIGDRTVEGSVIRSLANLYADFQANLAISNLTRTNDFANQIQSTASPTTVTNTTSGEGTTLSTSKPEKKPVSPIPSRSDTNSELTSQTGGRLPSLQNSIEANAQETKVFAGGLNTQVLVLRQQALAIYRG